MASSPTTPDTIYISLMQSLTNNGVFVSTDAGISWTNTGYTSSATEIVSDLEHDNVLYLRKQSSPWSLISVDHGASFTLFNGNLVDIGDAWDLTFVPGDPSRLLLVLRSLATYHR